MQDPRALMNPKNLESYRAWGQEGVRRSGFGLILAIVTGFTPLITVAGIVFRPAIRNQDGLLLFGAGLAVYLGAVLGLMLFAVLRFNAWKRAHPWEPPPRSLRWK